MTTDPNPTGFRTGDCSMALTDLVTTEPKPRGQVTHRLKTWPEYFAAVWSGRKNFEVRKDDRPEGYEAGDLLHLVEYDHGTKQETVRRIAVRVTYVLKGGQFGIEAGYAVLGLGVVQRTTVDAAAIDGDARP
jgi:hypothetical protein